MSEPLTVLLAELAPAEPDPARAEQIRIRCRARLVQQARRAPVSRDSIAVRTAKLWQPLIAALGVAYLTEVIVQALHLFGVS